MLSLRAISLDRIMSALPGWLFVFAAMAILGATLLTPQWLSSRELAWRAEVMKAQTGRLEQLHKRYIAFLDALNAGDIELYEQLAFMELHLKPEGKEFLLASHPIHQGPRPNQVAGGNAIERQLDVSMDVIGDEVEPFQPINTRLVRMTTRKNSRIVLLVLGMGCLVLGLWPLEGSVEAGRDDDDES